MEDEQPTREANKICGVCGDRALGYNFNAVTCESCKAFFRRNALKNKDFRCPFTENCSVTPVTRRFCQKCRLDKCFSIGMRKEYIMTEEDKVLKRQKIEQNRAKKRPAASSPRAVKMKREIIEDSNYDDTSLSVASVASTISESYFWESDRKYTDLNGHQQPVVIESMSPVTAASVPSPSSPESAKDVIGSKTLDMQKDTCQRVPKNTKNTNSKVYRNLKKCKILLESSLDSTSDISSEKNHQVECSPASVASVCEFQAQHSPSSSDVMKKLQCPNFLSKLMRHPQLIMELFRDENLLAKLADNPNISKLLNENEMEEDNLDRYSRQCLANNGISDHLIRNMLDTDQSNVENPILANLIAKNSDNSGDKSPISRHDYRKITDDMTRDVVQDVERTSIEANSIESILCEAIKLEFSAYSTLGGNQSNRELNDAERAKLNELIVANKALLAPLDDDITHLVGDECKFKGHIGQSDPMLLDVINLTAIAIRRLIKMAKKINAFKNMCQEDQLALLKGGCTEMLILRSALSYDSDKDAWKIPHSQESLSNIKADVLKEANGNLYAEHTRFVKNFDPRWRDENIILILSAIALFTPNRPRVIHSDVIKLEQNSYYYLLRRYLESIYPGCEAKSTFLKLIQKISDLHRLNNEVVDVYLNVNPSSVEPLLIEIFDLKR